MKSSFFPTSGSIPGDYGEPLLNVGFDFHQEGGANNDQDPLFVNFCDIVPSRKALQQGQASKVSAAVNVAKGIVGAGSFALPHVFKEEGTIGGTLALVLCGLLATHTMETLSTCRMEIGALSYVDLARETLGEPAARLVFVLTMCASLGVCTSYLIFMSQTLQDLSFDVESNNLVALLLPETKMIFWQMMIALVWLPLALVRNYKIFAFTSAIGVFAASAGMLVVLISGIYNHPGDGLTTSIERVTELPHFPDSFQHAFGSSFGKVSFIFCVNFLTFPIMESMQEPKNFPWAVRCAVFTTGLANIVFALLCYGFFGEETSDLVLANIGNDPFLSSLKILLCLDLLLTFPIIFGSSRQIVEQAMNSRRSHGIQIGEGPEGFTLIYNRAGIALAGILICLAQAQFGNFGEIVNLVGGVAQGTLAFIMPPAIVIALDQYTGTRISTPRKLFEEVVFLFGIFTVVSTLAHSAFALGNHNTTDES